MSHSSFGTESYSWKELSLSDAALEIINQDPWNQQDLGAVIAINTDPQAEVCHPIVPLVDLPAAAGIYQALGSTEHCSCALWNNTGGTVLLIGNAD